MIISLDFKSVTLAPNEVRPMAVGGAVFSCLTSTAQFFISIDGGPFIPLQGGIQIDNRPNPFTSIILQNNSSVPVTLTFYSGTSPVSYSPVTVQTTTTNAPTYTKGSDPLNAAATVFSGQDVVAGVTKLRKQILISNLPGDGVNALSVQDGNGKLMVMIPAGQVGTLETSGKVTIANPGGVNYSVGEIFYA